MSFQMLLNLSPTAYISLCSFDLIASMTCSHVSGKFMPLTYSFRRFKSADSSVVFFPTAAASAAFPGIDRVSSMLVFMNSCCFAASACRLLIAVSPVVWMSVFT